MEERKAPLSGPTGLVSPDGAPLTSAPPPAELRSMSNHAVAHATALMAFDNLSADIKLLATGHARRTAARMATNVRALKLAYLTLFRPDAVGEQPTDTDTKE